MSADFGIYIHWPFCESRCPYCDFNAHVRPKVFALDDKAMGEAFARELSTLVGMTALRNARSVFFGGGTPSLMPPSLVGALIEDIHKTFGLARDAEITLEANPSSVEATRFAGYRAAGVNRISIGVQSFDDAILRFLGRRHGAKEASLAVTLAQKYFPRVSFDLIYALPEHGCAQWRSALSEACARSTGHLSLYQLTLEKGTAFFDLAARGRLRLPDAEQARRLFDLTQEVTNAHGLSAYEISNHAQTGHESVHNLIYWRYGFYLGLGPGAHGRFTDDSGRLISSANVLVPKVWHDQVLQTGHGFDRREVLGQRAQGDEYLLMSLRLREGLDLERYARLSGRALSKAMMDKFSALGLVRRDKERLCLTSLGRPLINRIVCDLASA